MRKYCRSFAYNERRTAVFIYLNETTLFTLRPWYIFLNRLIVLTSTKCRHGTHITEWN